MATKWESYIPVTPTCICTHPRPHPQPHPHTGSAGSKW